MDRTRLTLLALVALVPPGTSEAQTPALPPPRLGGYIQVRQVAQEDIGLTATLNRARVSLEGPLPSRVSYRFLVEYEAPTGARTPAAVSLREAFIRWAPGAFAVTAGQFKTPFSREYLIPVPALETPDLAAVVDSQAPKYDVGVQARHFPSLRTSPYAGLDTPSGIHGLAFHIRCECGCGGRVLAPVHARRQQSHVLAAWTRERPGFTLIWA